MSTVVTYAGGAPAVIGPDGLLFPRGERVEVPEELAETLGSDFGIGPDFAMPTPTPEVTEENLPSV